MAKELYLYTGIYSFVAQNLIASINENIGEEMTLRVNSPGGDVFANYGICAKISEHGNINIKVDGAAMSAAAILLPYAKDVECLDVSTFILHRADMYVSSEEEKEFLAKINKDLKAKLLLKINPETFKEVTGVSIDEMFDSEKRIDIVLDAKQAKKIGLVSKINKLTPAEVTAFNNKMYSVSATAEPIKNNLNQNNNMDLNKLKADHPALFAEVLALGVAQEKNRVEACLVFIELDAKGVKEAIESGKDLTPKQMAEFSLKAVNAASLKATQADSAESVKTPEAAAAQTEKEKKEDAFLKDVEAGK